MGVKIIFNKTCFVKIKWYFCSVKQSNNKDMKEKRQLAAISRSIYGESFKVEYKIGNTLYYEHFETLAEAKIFCFNNSMNFSII